MNIPNTIRCRVVKKSVWCTPAGVRCGNSKSITLDVIPGRYFAVGDETDVDRNGLLGNVISLSASEEVPCFFDGFEVGQEVELEIKVCEPIKPEQTIDGLIKEEKTKIDTSRGSDFGFGLGVILCG